jgi:hypothetical protein
MAQTTERALTTEIPACLGLSNAQLAKRYSATGRFYQVESKSVPHEPFRCREALEIFRPGSSELECDAVFVMMNPGGSRPLEVNEPTRLEESTLVPTRPDDTQYQLMRLMEAFGWEHVRVLNLSDVRESDSTKLPELLSRCIREQKNDGHSVFSASRQAGLSALLMRQSSAPVILAWGVSPKLKKLAGHALSQMRDHGVAAPLGLEHPTRKGWAYYHPLPRSARDQQRWREDAFVHIARQLNRATTVSQ